MSNIWSKFEKLLPKKKQFIGTVNSINISNKTCVVLLRESLSTITINASNVQVGLAYLIEDGRIIQELPSLSSYDITIY